MNILGKLVTALGNAELNIHWSTVMRYSYVMRTYVHKHICIYL